jgi:hypothetical protein
MPTQLLKVPLPLIWALSLFGRMETTSNSGGLAVVSVVCGADAAD